MALGICKDCGAQASTSEGTRCPSCGGNRIRSANRKLRAEGQRAYAKAQEWEAVKNRLFFMWAPLLLVGCGSTFLLADARAENRHDGHSSAIKSELLTSAEKKQLKTGLILVVWVLAIQGLLAAISFYWSGQALKSRGKRRVLKEGLVNGFRAWAAFMLFTVLGIFLKGPDLCETWFVVIWLLSVSAVCPAIILKRPFRC